jgi:hypothetical protein
MSKRDGREVVYEMVPKLKSRVCVNSIRVSVGVRIRVRCRVRVRCII